MKSSSLMTVTVQTSKVLSPATLKIRPLKGTSMLAILEAGNAVDDITPTAFEEANGSGSGTYTVDFGSGMDGSMSIAYANGDILGTGISVKYSYYPKLDGKTNNEKGSSAANDSATDSAESINVGIPLAGLPIIGSSPLGGAKITLGYENSDSIVTDAQAKEGGTAAVVIPVELNLDLN